jgi:outer membrane protein assembly factor BamC
MQGFHVTVSPLRLSSRLSTLALTCVLAGLTACSTTVFDNDKVNYKTDERAKPVALEIPPDLSQLSRGSRYAMPGGTVSAASLAQERQTAQGVTAPASLGDVRIERSGTQRWLVVNRPADKVWPVVHEFWLENGFTYTAEQASIGLLETEWAENRAKLPQDFLRRMLGKVVDGLYSTGERDKYRTRIESVDRNTTEITVSHRGMVENYADSTKGSTVWQPRPSDPSLEVEFLRRLMIKLGGTVEQANQATQAPAQAAATLVSVNDKQQAILYVEALDVAWRRVGVALDRTGFTVEDRDRNQGLFFVRYVDKPNTENEGFFKRLISRSSQPEGPVRYRILLTREGSSGTRISVLNGNGEPDTSEASKRILQLLIDELK